MFAKYSVKSAVLSATPSFLSLWYRRDAQGARFDTVSLCGFKERLLRMMTSNAGSDLALQMRMPDHKPVRNHQTQPCSTAIIPEMEAKMLRPASRLCKQIPQANPINIAAAVMTRNRATAFAGLKRNDNTRVFDAAALPGNLHSWG